MDKRKMNREEIDISDEISVSVIVPVYNERAYLDDLMKSLLKQSFVDYEVLFIDDGSIDGTKEKLGHYEKQYPHKVKVIYLPHKGVSNARNIGIELARGRFVLFIDADDYIYPNMLERLYYEIVEKEADIVVCNAERQNKKGWYVQSNEKSEYLIDLNQYGKGMYIVNYIFSEKHKYCVWNKMFRKKYIIENNIRYIDNSEIYPEDLIFVIQMVSHAGKILWIPDILYKHFSRNESITSSYRNKIFERYFNSLLYIKEEIRHDKDSFNYIVIDLLCNAFTASIKCNKMNCFGIANELRKNYMKYIKLLLHEKQIIKLSKKRKIFVFCLERDIIILPSIIFFISIKYELIGKL